MDKNRATRHDKNSDFTSSKKRITNSKLEIPLSLYTNTRLTNIRSKILHNLCRDKKIDISRAIYSTQYTQPRKENTVDTPNQSNNRSQSVDNNLSNVYSRNPRTPATTKKILSITNPFNSCIE